MLPYSAHYVKLREYYPTGFTLVGPQLLYPHDKTIAIDIYETRQYIANH